MIRTVLQRASILTLAALLISPMALAQTDDPADDFSPEELEAVAEVLVQIEDVRTKYKEKIRKTDEPGKIRVYQRQMTLEIDRTIEQHEGISIKRYEEITQTAQSNVKLKQKILTLAKKQRGEQVKKSKGR